MGNCLGSADSTDNAQTKNAAAGGSTKKQESAKPRSATDAKKNNASVKQSGKGASSKDKKNGEKKGSGRRNQSTIHSVIMKEHSLDVYEKYEETEVLGNGSMGHVAKVKIKQAAKGGSAYVGGSSSKVGGGKTAADAAKAKAFLKEAGIANSSRSKNSVATLGSVDENASQTGGGSGATSDIGRGSNVEKSNNHDSYALKSIQLDRVSTTFIEELKNEIDILKAMDHPNIVKLHEVFSHRKQIYMILELCDGGDLYTRLPYTEKDSAYISGKLLSAIKYMHDHGIVHRDLKFENIMFENKSDTAEIKVIDFGLSKKFASQKLGLMREGVGTLYSMAPQVLQGVYTSQADMWSVGVITYMLLSSHRPFYNKKRKVMIDRIMRCDYTFAKDYWKPISSDAKDFIDHLLVLDPKVRYSAVKAQSHKWMHKEFKLEDRTGLTNSMLDRTYDNLNGFKNNLALKKLALNVVAHKSNTAQIRNLRKAFDKFDTANNGVISSEEFKAALQDKCDYSDKEIKEMFDAIDINNTGDIMYTEFIAATLEAQGEVDEDRIAEAFDRLDVDNSGSISKENIMVWLKGTDTTMEDIEAMIAAADIDNCGSVSFEEFLAMFRTEAKIHSLDSKSMNVEDENNKSARSRPSASTKAGRSLISSVKESIRHLSEFEENSQSLSKSRQDDDDDDGLVGLDAVIPGGKFDTTRSDASEKDL